jgi:hypothetical protein
VKKALQLTTFLLAALLAARAQEASGGMEVRTYRQGNSWVQEQSGTLSGAKTIRIATDAGSVKVRGAAQPNISYVMKKRVYNCGSEADAQKYLRQFRITAWQRGDVAELRGICEFCGYGRKSGSVDFDIVVPQNVTVLSIETEGGDLGVHGIAGRLDAETGGGTIQVDEVGGGIRATSGGGNIDIGKAGGDLVLETGGGSIRVVSAKRITAQSGGGKIEIQSGQVMLLETGGGSIEVSNASGDLRASTGGGNINIGSVTGRTILETGGGSIRLSSSNGPVSAQSGGGSIELYKLRQGAVVETGSGGIIAEFVALAPGATASHLETAAGDIIVYLADDLKISVSAAIDVGNGHLIRSDFSTIKVTADGDSGPQEYYATGTLNGGGPPLKIHTSVGNIELRRQVLAGGR